MRLAVVAICVLGAALAAAPAGAATYRVDSKGGAHDSNIGNGTCRTAGGDCTIRAAVDEANATADTDRIRIGPGRFELSGTPDENDNAGGDYDLIAGGGKTVITGAGASRTVLDGGFDDRLFQVFNTATVRLSGVKLTRGKPDFDGGGLASSGEATVSRSVISGNRAQGGGGLSSTGDLTVLKSTITKNKTTTTAGGLATTELNATFPGILEIRDSTVSGNSTGGGGGGGLFAGPTTIYNSTFTKNEANGSGGAFRYEGPGPSSVTSSTIVRNSAGTTGGIESLEAYDLAATIVALNGNGDDCAGGAAPVSLGFNLDDDGSCSSSILDFTAGNVRLKSLQRNGGPTRTVLPRPASPAVDVIPDATSNCAGRDQRGVKRPRPAGGLCDIGSVERD